MMEGAVRRLVAFLLAALTCPVAPATAQTPPAPITVFDLPAVPLTQGPVHGAYRHPSVQELLQVVCQRPVLIE